MTQVATPDETNRTLEAERRSEHVRWCTEQGEAAAARGQRLMEASVALRRQSWEVRMRSKAVRDWAEAVRAERHRDLEHHAVQANVKSFSVEGQLAGRPVWARWEWGHLECDPHLLTQARLLVDLGTVFRKESPPAWVEATLTGWAPAVMLTLARACDIVLSIDFEPAAAG